MLALHRIAWDRSTRHPQTAVGELLSKRFHAEWPTLPVAHRWAPAQLAAAAGGGELGGVTLAVPLGLLLATKLTVPVIAPKIPNSQLRGKTGFRVMSPHRLPFQSTERFSLPSDCRPGYYKAREHFKNFP